MRADIVARGLRKRKSETIILKRGASTVSCIAKVWAFEPRELVGPIKQGDRRAIISNEEIAAEAWPGPPRRGDRVNIEDGTQFTIEAVDTRKMRGEIASHWLVIRGGS